MKKVVPIYPWPMHAVVAEALGAIPDLLVVEARPGGPGPVLAIKKLPPFVCDAVLVMRPDRLTEAVNIVISDGIEMVSMRDHVAKIVNTNDIEEIVETGVSKVRFS
jgi:hypothetical protein